jgi:amidase
MDLSTCTALQLSGALARREISAVDLMQATLERIDAVNPAVNAIVSLRDRDSLMAEARAADAAQSRGWLHGIPMAIKDLMDVAGLRTTEGSRLHAERIAEKDDPVVARLRAAGAIFIGKTNTPEFGLGSHTVNPVHGATRNPYDLSRSAGGSSGGAAAALATGMVAVADGSDMMGSLRNPAAWNNVYGMRPTWGLVADPDASDIFINQFSTDGPMARCPGDLAALLDTMAGTDGQGALLPRLDRLEHLPRLGWLGDWGGALPMEPGLLDFLEGGIEAFRSLGFPTLDLAAPFPAPDLWVSWLRLRAYVKAMGKRDIFADRALRDKLGSAMIWEIETGLSLTPAEIWEASEIRTRWYRRCMALFSDVDILVQPSAQLWPFDVTLDHPREIAGRPMDTYHRWMEVVIPASLIGLPVVNVPCGFGAGGLPMGLQLIGAPGSDALLLQTARRWHSETGWPQRRPAMI